jgi:CBS domain-containing protein
MVLGINNTYTTLKQLAIDPKYSDIPECAEAFLTLSKLRTVEGFEKRTGSIYKFGGVVKIDKEKLKNALPMRELEELIKNKFQLTQFMLEWIKKYQQRTS